MGTKRTIHGPKGYRLELDQGEVFFDDPGQGTPALVYDAKGNSGTYWCVMGEAEIESRSGGCEPIPNIVWMWLDDMEPAIVAFLYEPDVDAFGFRPDDVDDGYYQPEKETPYDR